VASCRLPCARVRRMLDMRTALRSSVAQSIPLAVLVAAFLAAAMLPTSASEPQSRLSPDNDIFDVVPLGLKFLWRAELGRVADKRIEAVYAAGQLVVAETPEGQTHVLDAETGRWKMAKNFRRGLDRPPGSSAQTLFLVSRNYVFSLDVAANSMTDGYSPGFVVSTAPIGYGSNALLAGGNGHLALVAPATGDNIWTVSLNGPIWEKPVLEDDRLFAAARDAGCVDVLTGQELWRWEPQPPARLTTGVAVDDNLLCVGDNRGTMYALDNRFGGLRWTKALDAIPIGTPVVADGYLLVPTARPSVIAVRIADDPQISWTHEGAKTVLTVGDHKAYLLNEDNSIAAIDVQKGAELWRDPLPADCLVAGDAERPVLYVADEDGSVAAFQELD
jgi:outer membrane protein assembly factor BamB